jgi:hypothetical protein
MEQLRGDIFIEHQQIRYFSLTAPDAAGYSPDADSALTGQL